MGLFGGQAVEALFHGFAFALDVDAPACQLGGETGVLTLFADGKAELAVGHHDDGRLDGAFFVQQNVIDLGRAECVGNIGRQLRAPFDDIDLFARQFVDDVLDAQAAHADATADGVDAGNSGDDRGLAARARFA